MEGKNIPIFAESMSGNTSLRSLVVLTDGGGAHSRQGFSASEPLPEYECAHSKVHP